MEPIYLDHAATTPTHPEVLEAMIPIYKQVFGNPSSIHHFGRNARKYIDEARESIALQIGAKSKEIVFTSGGTEADNMAIIGTASAKKDLGRHIITTKIEHHAVLNTCKSLEKNGFEVTYLDVDQNGQIHMEDFKNALREDTILVTIMYGNNEVGTIQPIQDIADFIKDHQAVFHTDAVQAIGTQNIDLKTLPIDLMSVTAHKFNGPKGVGFLYIRGDLPLSPYQHGGEQERKRRAGTHNVPGIVGMQKAIEIAMNEREDKVNHMRALRKLILDGLREANINYSVNGNLENSLPHIVNLYLPGTSVESLLMALDLSGIAVSSGSACTAGSIEPSHVLSAMYGSDSDQAKSSIRISTGLYNTKEQIQQATKIIADTVRRLAK